MDEAAWIAAVSAAIALGAGAATWWQATIAKRQTTLQELVRKDSLRPYVWVDYRLDPVSAWLVDLVIRNEGPTVATNIRVTFDPPVKRSAQMNSSTPLNELPAFSEGITSMPPGREMRWSLGSHVELYEQGALGRHKVTIRYDGPFGPEDPLEYHLDYADANAMAIRDSGNLKKLTGELRKTTKAVEAVSRRIRKPSDD
jgi:hypothetical protein